MPLELAQDVPVGSWINAMHAAKTISSQDHVAVPAHIHAIHHTPIPLIADALNPAFRVEIEQLHLRSSFDVKGLQA